MMGEHHVPRHKPNIRHADSLMMRRLTWTNWRSATAVARRQSDLRRARSRTTFEIEATPEDRLRPVARRAVAQNSVERAPDGTEVRLHMLAGTPARWWRWLNRLYPWHEIRASTSIRSHCRAGACATCHSRAWRETGAVIAVLRPASPAPVFTCRSPDQQPEPPWCRAATWPADLEGGSKLIQSLGHGARPVAAAWRPALICGWIRSESRLLGRHAVLVGASASEGRKATWDSNRWRDQFLTAWSRWPTCAMHHLSCFPVPPGGSGAERAVCELPSLELIAEKVAPRGVLEGAGNADGRSPPVRTATAGNRERRRQRWRRRQDPGWSRRRLAGVTSEARRSQLAAAWSGKVARLLFDHFGDFEGFIPKSRRRPSPLLQPRGAIRDRRWAARDGFR